MMKRWRKAKRTSKVKWRPFSPGHAAGRGWCLVCGCLVGLLHAHALGAARLPTDPEAAANLCITNMITKITVQGGASASASPVKLFSSEESSEGEAGSPSPAPIEFPPQMTTHYYITTPSAHNTPSQSPRVTAEQVRVRRSANALGAWHE